MKKKQMQKIFSLCVVAAMVLTSFAYIAQAEETTGDEPASVANGSYTLEFEEYLDCFSASSVVSSNGAACHNWLAGDQTFTKVLNVSETGVYDFEFKGAYQRWLSAFDIMLDNTLLYSVKKEDTTGKAILDAEGNQLYYYGNNFPAKCWNFTKYVSAGEHTLTINIHKRTTATSAATDNASAFAFDSLSMVCREASPVAGDTVRFEFEDFATDATSVTSEDGSQTLLSHNWTTVQPKIAIPFTIEKSGYYDVDCVIGNNTIEADGTPKGAANYKYISRILLYMDGELICDNQTSKYKERVTDGFQGWSGAPLCKYQQSRLYLEAGDSHFIEADVQITADKAYKYNLDYIQIAPAESFVAYELGNIEASLSYDAPVTGTVLLAVYNDKELVTVKSDRLSNERQICFSFPLDAKYTHVKSFLWKDLNDMIPFKNSVLHEVERKLYSIEPEELFMIDADVFEESDTYPTVTNSPESPIRMFPLLWRFGDTMIAGWGQHTDTYETAPYDAIMISRDGGKTWGEKQVNQDFNFSSMCQLEDDTLLGVNYYTHYVDNRTATVYYWTSDDLGATWTKHEGAIHYDMDITANSGGWGSIVMNHYMRQLPDGRLQGLAYGKYTEDTTFRVVVIESNDGGKNWYVTSTVASGDPLDENGTKVTGVEGFCEPCMTECDDGSLLCVMRIGSYRPLYQCRSFDGGVTWSTPEILPGIKTYSEAYSVEPVLCSMDNGVLVLTTGRPGARMLVSLDGSGYLWQEKCVPLYTDPSDVLRVCSGYTGICQIGEDRVLVIGDIGSDWSAVHGDRYKPGEEYGIWGRFVNIERRTSDSPYLEQAHLSYFKRTMQVNDTQKLMLSALDNDGRKLTDGYTVSYSCTGDAVTISADGTVTANAVGTATITATVTAKDGKTVTSNQISVVVESAEN